ncbi:MAG: hypothetical protein ACO2ON_01650 [Candidatus Nanopusillus sp.]
MFEKEKNEIRNLIIKHVVEELQRRQNLTIVNINPLEYEITKVIRESIKRSYYINDDKQRSLAYKISSVVNDLYSEVLELHMILDSGTVKDEPTKMLLARAIWYLSSKIYSLTNKYETVTQENATIKLNIPLNTNQNVQKPQGF